MRIGGTTDLFNLRICIGNTTKDPSYLQERRNPDDQTDARWSDYDTLALLVAAYRVLDVHLLNSGALPLETRRASQPVYTHMHYNPVEDWADLVLAIPPLVSYGLTTLSSKTTSQNSADRLCNLVKKEIGATTNVSLSTISSNLHRAAMYLMYLCDKSCVSVSSFILTSQPVY